MKTTTWKNAVLLVPFAIFALIIVLALASASAQDMQSKTSICKEVGQGKYQNLNKLLKPNSSLRDIKFNDNGEPIYTGQQTLELMALSAAECGVRIIPFIGDLIDAIEKDISYCKNYKDRNNQQGIDTNTLNQIAAKGALCGFLSPLTLIAS